MEEDPDLALARDSRLDEISRRFHELVQDRAELIKELEADFRRETLLKNKTVVEMGRTIDALRSQIEELIKERTQLVKDKAELISKITPAKVELETPDGEELDPKGGNLTGSKMVLKNPKTGERVVVKDFTELDVVKAKLEIAEKDKFLLYRQVGQLTCENATLHRKVNDLGHKFSQTRRERDKLAEKLRKAEREAHFYRGLVFEKLSQLIDEVC